MQPFFGDRMPYFFVAVLILSFLLLMIVFRSVLVPLKAVLMNLLSIGAAYGIMVTVLQWGWFSDITGLAPGPIEAFRSEEHTSELQSLMRIQYADFCWKTIITTNTY